MIDLKDKAVYLGMPTHDGKCTIGAARGFWKASKRGNLMVEAKAGSLLANNFNGLWCRALNASPKIDYFAMQHADIEPEDWWLDTLIDEMEAHNLDVLGVAVPIKDSTGVTSVALHNDLGDNWRPLCRLTMAELHQLPETFTSEDVGHPLLLNTGLWVCRFDLSWATRCCFTINDCLSQDPESGRYYADVEPEDWYFSRNLHALGLKIGCTRKIKVMHRGEQCWPNFHVWGNSFDKQFVSESQILAAESAELMEV